ncbi:helix-turn-helix domain-containing protein [Streptomyces sp. NPDC052040]|uniref:helix-turn-helix domain-containing protein n=1 Tax=unclassified Streptomyces TaxID=2593676 RepID=UPI0037D254BD
MVSGADAAAAFGRLLRELKDRSGLSYGTLAKRLHMSTSTLHRYCNGDAVPTDYAPVERLARLCKASPEELVELHRRWVLADAVRGQERERERERKGRAGAVADGEARPAAAPEAGAGAPPEADVPAVAAPRAAAPPTDASRADASLADASRAGDLGADVPQADVPGVAASRTGVPRTGLPQADAPSAASAQAATAHAASAHAAATQSAAPARAGSRRRLRPAVFVPVGAVVLLGAAVLAWAPFAPGGDQAKGPVGVSSPADRGFRTSPTDTRSPSPSASRSGKGSGKGADRATGASRSPGPGDGSAAPGAGAGAGSGSGTGDQGDTGTAVPVTVLTRPYAFEDPCSQHYLINRPPGQVPPPPTEQDAPGWVSALGAVSSGGQYVVLTVQGTGASTVVLNDLKVRVVSSDAPLAWNDYGMGAGCGGGVDTEGFDLDLDAGRPALAPARAQHGFPFKVSESDPEVFQIRARTAAHDIHWYLELEWSSGARHGTIRLDDQGKPFRTSGSTGRPSYDFPIGNTQWETHQPG